jgi:outer membrane protein TolC
MKRASGILASGLLLLTVACTTPDQHRHRAEADAQRRIQQVQEEWLGQSDPFTIERPADSLRRRMLLDQDLPHVDVPVPSATLPPGGEAEMQLKLEMALMIGAAHSPEYQERKEDIFRAALNLDVEAFAFQNSFSGILSSDVSEDRSGTETERGVVQSLSLGMSRTLQVGATISSRIMFDLVKLLAMDRDSAYGMMADVTLTVPLLRGAGRRIVTEPLTQAERTVAYAMYTFEQFKRQYAVRVASDYLQVLQQKDRVQNAIDNYDRVEISAARARRLAEAGRLPEIQVDQAQQEELRARERWLSAQSTYERRLDQFKITLGLPADAAVVLDESDLTKLSEWVMPQEHVAARAAIELALEQRPDMALALARVEDAQRGVQVAADELRWNAVLKLSGQAGGRRGIGTVAQGDARLDPAEGIFGAGLEVEAPWSRRTARNAYRDRFIALERSVREVEVLEDQIKAEVRQSLRTLAQARENIRIQGRAVEVAQRRVDSTELFLQAGRAQIRDVLEAQEALVSARDGFTSAVVTYRVTELELQRDMGVLRVDADGVWTEFDDWDTVAATENR